MRGGGVVFATQQRAYLRFCRRGTQALTLLHKAVCSVANFWIWDYPIAHGDVAASPSDGQPSKRCSLYLWKRAMDGRALTPTRFVVASVAACVSTGVVRNAFAQSTTWYLRSRATLRALVVCAVVLPTLTIPLQARGPEAIPDVTEQVIDAVVNIATSQRVGSLNNTQQPPALPNSPQQDEVFRDFLNQRGPGGNDQEGVAPPQLVRTCVTCRASSPARRSARP